MATSGTTTFDLDLNSLVEEAFERCGAELRTGYDLRTARRSLNLLTAEWANRGVNLWTIEEGSVSLTEGTITYNLPTNTIDLIEQVIRTGTGTNQTDTNLTRITVSTYAQTANKNTTGRPTQIFVQRLSDKVDVTFYPVPDSTTTYTLFYYRIVGIDGISSGISGTTTSFIPPRFVPCLVSGLAYYVAMKRPEVSNRVSALKQEYEFQFELAAGEDSDSASARFVPYNTFFGS